MVYAQLSPDGSQKKGKKTADNTPFSPTRKEYVTNERSKNAILKPKAPQEGNLGEEIRL